MFADCDVGVQLTFHTGHCGESGDRGDLTRLPVQIGASENITEKMGFEILVDSRSELKQRPFHRATGQLCLIRRSEFNAFSLRQRTGQFPLRISDAFCLTFPEQFHETAERVQTAGETAVRVKLSQDLLDPVHCQPAVESVCKRLFQVCHIALRRKTGDCDDPLFFAVQCVVHSFICLHIVDDTK